MVDCENLVRLDAYHDGELSPAERTDVEAHLRDCPSCAAELTAMRRMSAGFSAAPPRGPSHEQLVWLARSVRAEPPEARMLLRLFRGTAVAAAVVLACSLAGAAYLSQRTRAAAHEAMVLDHLTIGSHSAAFPADPAQWIADDLRGRQEGR